MGSVSELLVALRQAVIAERGTNRPDGPPQLSGSDVDVLTHAALMLAVRPALACEWGLILTERTASR